jgi:hypothetical protein
LGAGGGSPTEGVKKKIERCLIFTGLNIHSCSRIKIKKGGIPFSSPQAATNFSQNFKKYIFRLVCETAIPGYGYSKKELF